LGFKIVDRTSLGLRTRTRIRVRIRVRRNWQK